MMKSPLLSLLLCLSLLFGQTALVFTPPAQAEALAQNSLTLSPVISSGLALPNAVRYNLTFFKPQGLVLEDFFALVVLPPGLNLIEMLQSPDTLILQRVAGAPGQGESLVWGTSLSDSALTPLNFSFTVDQAISQPLSVLFTWAGATPGSISYRAVPPLIPAQSEAGSLILGSQDTGVAMLPIGQTGIFIGVGAGVLADNTPLSVQKLPADFNPPAEFGEVWWCSLVDLQGLPAGAGVSLQVPLRRPLPPGRALEMFQQGPDGQWAPLAQKAVVTADGQFAAYTHPGGVVATGVEGEAQPELAPAIEVPVVPVEEAIVEPPPPPADTPPAVSDGTSNTVFITEENAPPPADTPPAVSDGTSNTIFITEENAPPPADTPPAVSDGTSNTIFIGEDGSVRQVSDGLSTPPPDGEPILEETPPAVTDGTSNTIFIGEDGSVRQVSDGLSTPSPDGEPILEETPPAVSDGTSNTIFIGEDGSVRQVSDGLSTPPPDGEPILEETPPAVTDGTSNTVFITEETAPPIAEPPPAVTDGTSNTVIVSEEGAGGQDSTQTTEDEQTTPTPPQDGFSQPPLVPDFLPPVQVLAQIAGNNANFPPPFVASTIPLAVATQSLSIIQNGAPVQIPVNQVCSTLGDITICTSFANVGACLVVVQQFSTGELRGSIACPPAP